MHADANGTAPFPDIVPLMRQVFACGAMPAAEFCDECPSVSSILKIRAVTQDLPKGAEKMTDTFRKRTEERLSSSHFRDLVHKIQESVQAAQAVPPPCASIFAPQPPLPPPSPHPPGTMQQNAWRHPVA